MAEVLSVVLKRLFLPLHPGLLSMVVSSDNSLIISRTLVSGGPS